MTFLAMEIAVRLVEIKNALKDHDDDRVLHHEMFLYKDVLKGIAIGTEYAADNARVVFIVERMKLAQREADRKAAEKAEKAATAVAKRTAAVKSAKGSTKASGAKVSPATSADLDSYAQGNLSVYELRKRELAARLRGQVSRNPVE